MKLITCLIAFSITLAATGCSAKRVPTTFSAMEKRAPAGTTVYVTTSAGNEFKGTLAEVSGSSMKISLRDASTQDFTEADVARIRAKDKLWNGMLIGAGIGGVFAFMLNDAGCVEPYAQPDCKDVSRAAGVAVTAGIGAAVGALFDALHHRRVFRGPRPGRGTSVFVAPLLPSGGAVIRVSSRF